MKRLGALAVICALIFSLAACGSTDKGACSDDSATFVTVNGTAYSQKDFDDFFNLYAALNQLENSSENKEYFMNNGFKENFVFEMLVVQEAEKEGVEVSLKDTDDILTKDVTAAYGSKDNFVKQILGDDVSWDDMVKYYQIALDYEALLDKRISDSDIDLEAVYNADPSKYSSPEQVSARHILVETEDEAKDIIKQLDDGADFASLAEEYSTDKGSATQGGSLGYFTKEQMVQEFSDAAFSTPVGSYTETPVKSQFGYHIILVEDHTSAHQMTFEEAEDYVRADVENDLSESFYNDLLANADIVYADTDTAADSESE